MVHPDDGQRGTSPNVQGGEPSLRDRMEFLFRRLPGMSIVFCGIVALALLWLVLVRGELYEATSKLLVHAQSDQAPDTIGTARDATGVGHGSGDIGSETELLTSTELLAEVVDRLALDRRPASQPPPDLLARLAFAMDRLGTRVRNACEDLMVRLGLHVRLTPREEAIAMLEQGLRATAHPDTGLILVALDLPSREDAAKALNDIVDLYLERRQRLFRDDDSTEMLEREEAASLEELQLAESELTTLQASADIVDITDQKRLLLESIAKLEREIDDLHIALEQVSSKAMRARAMLAHARPDFAALGDFPQDSFPNMLMRELAALQQERTRLESTAVASDPELHDNRERATAVLEQIAGYLEASAGERRAVYESRSQALTAMRQRLATLLGVDAAWRDASRRARLAEERYMLYRGKREQAAAAAALRRARIGNVSVVQRATTPLRPAGTPKVYLLAMAVVLAALASFSWAVVVEFLDHRVYRARQVTRHLGVPVLGVIAEAGDDRMHAGTTS